MKLACIGVSEAAAAFRAAETGVAAEGSLSLMLDLICALRKLGSLAAGGAAASILVV